MNQTTQIPTLPDYQRIASLIREEILNGHYPPASLLPSTEKFAAMLSTSYSTIHAALKTLEKEGWVERLHGRGTYVAEPEKRFLRAGIYHTLDIFADEEATFYRCLNQCLVARLQALGKTTQIIIESRPEQQQDGIFEPLEQALSQRQIQCLIAPNLNSKSKPLLSRLSIPVAFMADTSRRRGVTFDEASFLRGSIQKLAEQGCRTIGFITNVPVLDGNFAAFQEAVAAAGLETRPAWMAQPPTYEFHLVEYGYRSFQRIWEAPECPEGLIVYPDVAARGVITAALQIGTHGRQIPKFVLHRNARTQVLCPFPVTWAISDEDAAAEALIRAIQQQFAGEKPEGSIVPFRFEYDDASRWQKPPAPARTPV